MVGQNVYTEQEIRFILDLLIKEAKGPEISEAYDKEFGKPLTPNQLRYVKNKYGKDPKYGYVHALCLCSQQNLANRCLLAAPPRSTPV